MPSTSVNNVYLNYSQVMSIMPNSTATIYAELLPNIRQISVIITLNAPCDPSTKVELSASGEQFILHHHGQTTILTLPGQVAPEALLQKPAQGSRELSWRLPLAGRPTRTSLEDAQRNETQWSAASLLDDAEFLCRSCQAVIVSKGSIKTWKDLPSENWAEMMDFWHCHKPNVPHLHGSSDQNSNRGYGANTKFSASTGVGFVDLTTFLLSDLDCPGVQAQVSTDKSLPPNYRAVSCSSCQNYLGYLDQPNGGTRLFKWRLSSFPSPSSAGPSITTILSAQLISIMQSQCVSRILIIPHPDLTSNVSISPKSLNCWIFGPSIRYSSSSTIGCTYERGQLAMKVFWQDVSSDETNAIMEKGSIEELLLPAQAIAELIQVLKDSASILPPSARTFQQWNVGLMERYDA